MDTVSIARLIAALALACATSAPGASNPGAPSRSPAPPPQSFRSADPPAEAMTIRELPAPRGVVKAADANGREPVGFARHLDGDAGAIVPRDLRWRELASGGHAANVRIVSPGAQALRVGIRMAPDSIALQARFRDADGSNDVTSLALEPSAAAQTRWSPVTFGESVDIELFAPAGADVSRARLLIEEISHIDALPRIAAKAIGSAGFCQFDVSCLSVSDDAKENASATALMFTTVGGVTYSCSGTLVNSAPFSAIPYFLTGSYCIGDAEEAATLNTLWNYSAASCGSNTVGAFRRLTAGATLLVRDVDLGFSFLRLQETPSGVWFSGWDANDVAANEPVIAVYHPREDLKKIATGTVTQAPPAPFSVRFGRGATEASGTVGSSIGSGLFHEDQYLVGVLWRGDSSCTNPMAADTYMPFGPIYDRVKGYLEANLSDIWYDPDESGWGLTIADHQSQMFVVWYTYLASGRPTWFVAPGGTSRDGRRYFDAALYQTTGPSYDAAVFDPATVTRASVGSVSIDFEPPDLPAGWARFSYTVNGVSGSKPITRQPFGNAMPQWGSDFTDIWFNEAQSGWGLTLAQHGNNIFGVLFVYDTDRQPLFVVMPGVTSLTSSSFAGDLFVTNSGGQGWNSPSFDASRVIPTPVGRLSMTYSGTPGVAKSAETLGWTIRNKSFTSVVARQPFGNAPPTPGATRTLTVQVSGNGTVRSTPAGILCIAAGAGANWAATCNSAFALGQGVALQATPAQGWRFAGWGGDCSGRDACAVTLTTNRTVTARFEQATSAMVFTALDPPDGRVGAVYAPSCFCIPAPQGLNDLCNGGVNPSGGQPPYHFQLDSGVGFPPFGITLHPNGCLAGTPTAAGSRTFSVCAIDLAATTICRTVQMNVTATAQACQGNFTFRADVSGFGCNNNPLVINGGLTFEGVNFTLAAGSATGTLRINGYPTEFTQSNRICSVATTTSISTPVFVNYAARTFTFTTIDGNFQGDYTVNAGPNNVTGNLNGPDGPGNFTCAPPG